MLLVPSSYVEKEVPETEQQHDAKHNTPQDTRRARKSMGRQGLHYTSLAVYVPAVSAVADGGVSGGDAGTESEG